MRTAMKKTISILFLFGLLASAQNRAGADRLMQAYQDRVLTESTASLKTDEHISMYQTLVKAQPAELHYQKLVNLRPDLSSYNRAAYFRFLYGDPENGVKIMKMAIAAGSPMAENTAWCQVELGKMYLKTGKLKDAEETYSAALRNFPNYH